jgi:hypothetical protein
MFLTSTNDIESTQGYCFAILSTLLTDVSQDESSDDLTYTSRLPRIPNPSILGYRIRWLVFHHSLLVQDGALYAQDIKLSIILRS